MTDALLTLLKWCLLGLLYLFFFRVLQATWAGSRPVAAVRRVVAPVPDAGAPTRGRARRSGSGRAAKGRQGPPKLVVVEPQGLAGREYAVNGELTIGRAASCHVTLDDTYISQLHARIWLDGDQVAVEDLGSTNGTYLNNQRVTTKQFASFGDQLRLGGIVMELR
ncbi:MAG: FHA domain-containing protein [Acidimicrobiia bacterium]|nr:FHA domain-containing protein [Acidimicrobiia bacterium]MDH4364628.1 FHA domain-containing protein [Acidimicrobiia bacterium]MDH5290747.1 FHA domain-containing protein [Acidimicrobiia bacterium]